MCEHTMIIKSRKDILGFLTRNIKTFGRSLENPKYPLLGVNLRILSHCGLYRHDNKILFYILNFISWSSIVFVICMFIELYFVRKSSEFLLMVAIFGAGVLSPLKMMFYVLNRAKWMQLTENISSEERRATVENDPKIIKLIRQYTTYARIITYTFCGLIYTTGIFIFFAPLFKYLSSSEYRSALANGTEAYPRILHAWYPIDNTTLRGYAVGMVIESSMIYIGVVTIAAFDSNAFTIMAFLKGQMVILRHKCENIFGMEESVTRRQALANIEECHRLHNYCIEQYKLFNSLLSPVLFIYVLICSITICSCVLQLSLYDSTLYLKMYEMEYTVTLSMQLFVYCWNSNALSYESNDVSQSVFASNWWRADAKMRKQLILLAGKLSPVFRLQAGPFIIMSMSTFQGIVQFTYSFYTLLTKS